MSNVESTRSGRMLQAVGYMQLLAGTVLPFVTGWISYRQMLAAHHELLVNGLMTVAMGVLQPEFRFNSFFAGLFLICTTVGTVSNGVALAYSAYLEGGRVEVGPLLSSDDMHLPLRPIANALLMYACGPFVLLALLMAAVCAFRARGRSFLGRLVLSVGFVLVLASCLLHMVVPPKGVVLYRYLVAGHISGTWGGVLLLGWGFALESIRLGGLLTTLLALSSIGLAVGHPAAFVYMALKGLFLHAADSINIQSATFSAVSKEIIQAAQDPVGWIDTVLPVQQIFYALAGVALLVSATPLAYGLGAGFLSRRQGRLRLQGFVLLLISCVLYALPVAFGNRRYLSYLHVVLVSASATSFIMAELRVSGVLGALFELLATASIWIYPAVLAIGAYTGTRCSFFTRMNRDSIKIAEVNAKMTGQEAAAVDSNPTLVELMDRLYLASAITAAAAYLLAILLSLRTPARSATSEPAKKKN